MNAPVFSLLLYLFSHFPLIQLCIISIAFLLFQYLCRAAFYHPLYPFLIETHFAPGLSHCSPPLSHYSFTHIIFLVLFPTFVQLDVHPLFSSSLTPSFSWRKMFHHFLISLHLINPHLPVLSNLLLLVSPIPESSNVLLPQELCSTLCTSAASKQFHTLLLGLQGSFCTVPLCRAPLARLPDRKPLFILLHYCRSN